MAYALEREPPGVMLVCHRCDTPLCVRPSHLFLGTSADNTRDSITKGRQPQSKLSPTLAMYIRRRYAEGGITQRELAKFFGVSVPMIHYIVKGKWWKDTGLDEAPLTRAILETKADTRRLHELAAAGDEVAWQMLQEMQAEMDEARKEFRED